MASRSVAPTACILPHCQTPTCSCAPVVVPGTGSFAPADPPDPDAEVHECRPCEVHHCTDGDCEESGCLCITGDEGRDKADLIRDLVGHIGIHALPVTLRADLRAVMAAYDEMGIVW